MATLTGGTLAAATLTALQFPGLTGGAMAPADAAAIANAIINDADPTQGVPGGFSQMGLLYVPNRGVLKVLPNDFVMVGPDGWPILVAGIACATTRTINGTPILSSTTMVMASSVLAAGWQPGGIINGTNIPANTKILSISADGLTVTMSAAATASTGAQAITYGSYAHS